MTIITRKQFSLSTYYLLYLRLYLHNARKVDVVILRSISHPPSLKLKKRAVPLLFLGFLLLPPHRVFVSIKAVCVSNGSSRSYRTMRLRLRSRMVHTYIYVLLGKMEHWIVYTRGCTYV